MLGLTPQEAQRRRHFPYHRAAVHLSRLSDHGASSSTEGCLSLAWTASCAHLHAGTFYFYCNALSTVLLHLGAPPGQDWSHLPYYNYYLAKDSVYN